MSAQTYTDFLATVYKTHSLICNITVGICVDEENVCFEPEGETACGNWPGDNVNLKYFL